MHPRSSRIMGKWPKIRSISFLRRVFFAGWFGRNHRCKSMSGLGWWSNSTKFSWRKEFQTQVFFWFFKLGYCSDVVERNNVCEKPPLSQFHPESYMEHVTFFYREVNFPLSPRVWGATKFTLNGTLNLHGNEQLLFWCCFEGISFESH